LKVDNFNNEKVWMEKSKNKPIKIKDLPSAGDDCADIKSKYDKFKNVSDKPNFLQLNMKDRRIINVKILSQ
jgi:hypothetical protein